MKIISYDNQLYQLSKSGTSKLISRILGVLLIGWAIGLAYILINEAKTNLHNTFKWILADDDIRNILIICFIFFLFVSGIRFFQVKTKTFKDTKVHEYTSLSPFIQSIGVLVVVFIFILPFTLLLTIDSLESEFRFLGSIVMGIFWIVFIFMIIDAIKKYKTYLLFGKSQLLTDKSFYAPGSTIRLQLKNDKLKGIILTYYLRNLHEYWENGSNTDDSAYVIHKTIHQENKKGNVNQWIEFEVPKNDKIKPTFYHYSKPFYWSIEVINQESGYFSQFIINVRS
jgi:hypothetical protein